MEAGTALKIFMQIYLCFDNVPYFNQQGGLGDAIFAPVYEILKNRGVIFRFFHKVDELNLNVNNPHLVEQIRITKQVDLVNEEYEPLINVTKCAK